MPVSIQLQTNKLLKFSSKSLAPLKEFFNCNIHCICTCPQETHCSSSDSPISGFHIDLNIFQIDELGNSVEDMFTLLAKIRSTTSVTINHSVIQSFN